MFWKHPLRPKLSTAVSRRTALCDFMAWWISEELEAPQHDPLCLVVGGPLSPVVAFRGKHNLTCELVTLYLPSDLDLKPMDLGIALFGPSIKLSNKGAVCGSDDQGKS